MVPLADEHDDVEQLELIRWPCGPPADAYAAPVRTSALIARRSSIAA